jgi:hypothetical protein
MMKARNLQRVKSLPSRVQCSLINDVTQVFASRREDKDPVSGMASMSDLFSYYAESGFPRDVLQFEVSFGGNERSTTGAEAGDKWKRDRVHPQADG